MLFSTLRKRICFFATLGLFSSSLISYAQNPFIQHIYTADPTARVFNDTLYVYPSTDTRCPPGKANNAFCMPGYHVFSTTDMNEWTDHGPILDHNSVPWVKPDSYGMWAPDAIEHKGKYYFYFPAIPKDESAFRQIGVAIADSPTGPFTSEPHYIEGLAGIDPNIFIDDDGRAYMYFGGGETLYVAELNDDLKSLKSKAQKILHLPKGYKEGPFVFKQNNQYYFTFPHAPNGSEEIAYAVGSSPMGPFAYQNKILDRWKDDCWTNHHSIVEYKQQWYIFYHHHDLSSDEHLRSSNVDKLYFDDEGNILPVEPTRRGVAYIEATATLEIDAYSRIRGASIGENLSEDFLADAHIGKTARQPANWVLQNIEPDASIEIDDIDFKKNTFASIAVYYASSKGKISLEIQNDKGVKVASVPLPKTEYASWRAVSVPITEQLKGLQNLHFSFKGDTKGLKLDWVKFLPKGKAALVVGGNISAPIRYFDDRIMPLSNKPVLFKPKKVQLEKVILPLLDDLPNISFYNGHEKVASDYQAKKNEIITLAYEETIPSINGLEYIPAMNYSLHEGIRTETGTQAGGNIGYINNDDFIFYQKIEFNNTVSGIEANVATQTEGGKIQVRLDSIEGEVVAELEVNSTGSWKNWKIVSAKMNRELSGTHSMYLIFKGKGNDYLFNMSWFKFSE